MTTFPWEEGPTLRWFLSAIWDVFQVPKTFSSDIPGPLNSGVSKWGRAPLSGVLPPSEPQRKGYIPPEYNWVDLAQDGGENFPLKRKLMPPRVTTGRYKTI